MTVKEVKDAVKGYGYSLDLADNDALFYTVLNLAIREINRLRPRTGSIVIEHPEQGVEEVIEGVLEYDLSQKCQNLDFAAAVLPLLKNGVPTYPEDPRGMLLHGAKLRLPIAESGTYEVIYEKAPSRFKNEEEDDAKRLPLDGDLCELVPLLVASYVWLDDEPDKAQHYGALYRTAKAEIRKHESIAHVIDRKGWS